MKGYYVIPHDNYGEPIEFIGKGAKAKALKQAKEFVKMGDTSVMIQRFDDNNENGYFAEEETIYIY